jgi:NDP-sugar pyrophosphorylase family protein
MPSTSPINTYVIILAAGKATRLRPLSDIIPKPLIKINGIPIISRVIHSFKEAGFINFIILVGYKQQAIKAELLKIQDVELEFIEQTNQLGMADGLLLCLNQFNEKKQKLYDFFITAADVVFSKQKINQMFSLYKNANADIILGLMKSKDKKIASGHGNVKISKDSELIRDSDIKHGLKIVDIVEKPEENQILSEYYSLPFYIFNQKIITYLEKVDFSFRGEKEMQDSIKASIKKGDIVRGINIIDHDITIENIGSYHLTFMEDIIKMDKRFRYVEIDKKF